MEKKSEKSLTAKQEAFCQEYLIDLNATQAAIRAGYKADNAKQMGAENLSKPYLSKRINVLKEYKESSYRDLCIIELDRGVMDNILKVFRSSGEANKWAKSLIAEKAYEIGVSVIKRRRGHIDSTLRYDIMSNAGFKCQCCGESPSKHNDVTLRIDHIVPFSLGGIDHRSNLQCLCFKCNISKGNRHDYNHNEGCGNE